MPRTPLGRARQGTYSIVALDQQTGELGVAVQSHWFSVGPIVPWARGGVGAVATQANADASYGPRALDLIERGASASEALNQLLAMDDAAATRQVALVDAHGGVAVHTGSACIAHAGHVTGAGVSCQANIMASELVWPAMLAAYESSSARLVERLLDALDAAEAAGGDLRGRQSAALLVVAPEAESWESTVSLRVEDHPEPLVELRRLLALHDAYTLAGEGDTLAGEGRHDAAAERYRRAGRLADGAHELLFWAGLGTAQSGDVDAGAAMVANAIALHPPWAELLTRIPAEVAPSATAVREHLGL
jgi:uncharacterized Ntn-hydrolase superfamily protein